MNAVLIESEVLDQGLERYTINLANLYPNPQDRIHFEQRWVEFYNSDPANVDIMWKSDTSLIYNSESIVPSVESRKPPLLLVFGNPAPHSVKAGIPFAYEGNGKEHRIWKVLRNTSLIDFGLDHNNLDQDGMNLRRKKQLHNLEYISDYKISFIQYFSMPSIPSKIPWTGVGGLFRLFGSNAMKLIEEVELKRIKAIVDSFMTNGGIIVAFQKDAYNGLKSEQMSTYSIDLAKTNRLRGESMFGKGYELICAPPTRLLHSKAMFNVLNSLKLRDTQNKY